MGDFSIKQISEELGIGSHVLRAWERRYSALTPHRDEAGRRIYTETQRQKIILLIQLKQFGVPLHKIANKSLQDLVKLQERLLHENSAFKRSENRIDSHYISKTIAAMQKLDFEKVRQEIAAAKQNSSEKDFLLQFVSPLLFEVGRLYDAKLVSVAQEHALTSILRIFLQSMMSVDTTEKQKYRVAITTVEEDYHEFGIMIAAILCKLQGFSVYYFGTSMPREELQNVVQLLRCDLVIMGVSAPLDNRRASYLNNYFSEIRLPKKTMVWLGGAGAQSIRVSKVNINIKKVESLFALDKLLERRANK